MMKGVSSNEMLNAAHFEAAFRPIYTLHSLQCGRATRLPLQTRRPLTLFAARKATAEAPSVPTEAAGQDMKAEEEVAKQLPAWMPWDRTAVVEQKQALAQLQVLLPRPPITSIASWDGKGQ